MKEGRWAQTRGHVWPGQVLLALLLRVHCCNGVETPGRCKIGILSLQDVLVRPCNAGSRSGTHGLSIVTFTFLLLLLVEGHRCLFTVHCVVAGSTAMRAQKGVARPRGFGRQHIMKAMCMDNTLHPTG